jgi:hypothetical protein
LGDEQSNEKLVKKYNMRFATSANETGGSAALIINTRHTRRAAREVAGRCDRVPAFLTRALFDLGLAGQLGN